MLKLFYSLFLFIFINSHSYSDGYVVDTTKAGFITLKSCLNATTQDIDTTITCPNRTSCQFIASSRDEGTPVAICATDGIDYCRNDSDCSSLGKPNCVIASSTMVPLSSLKAQGILDPSQVGICLALGGSSEDNVLGDALCKGISIVTGKAGRGFIAVMIIVIGLLFFTGKISWNMVLSVGLGTGAIFGAPAVVGLITGKPFSCRIAR